MKLVWQSFAQPQQQVIKSEGVITYIYMHDSKDVAAFILIKICNVATGLMQQYQIHPSVASDIIA